MTEEQIAKHNAKVDYNKSGLGIIGDIFSFLIFRRHCPLVILSISS